MRESFPLLDKRPYTIYNCAMSLDGRTSTVGNDSKFSNDVDWHRVHELRDSVDGICVGIGTVISDNPKLRVKFIENPRHPHRIVADSRLRIAPEADLINFERQGVRVIIGTTQEAFKNTMKVDALRSRNVEIFECGNGQRVDLTAFWTILKKEKINSVLVEGGGTLAYSLFQSHLIDELRVFIAPYIVSGNIPSSTAITMGEGYKIVDSAIQLRLVDLQKSGNGIFARYMVVQEKI